MCKDNVSAAAPSHVERLTGADRPHLMPVFSLKSGIKYSNRPESFVDVVEATTIDFFLRQRMPG